MEDAPNYHETELIEKNIIGYIFNYDEKGISQSLAPNLSKSNSISYYKKDIISYEKQIKEDFDRLRSYSNKSSDSEEIMNVLKQSRSSFGNMKTTNKINMKGRILINDNSAFTQRL